jgi:hypothetical protein
MSSTDCSARTSNVPLISIDDEDDDDDDDGDDDDDDEV